MFKKITLRTSENLMPDWLTLKLKKPWSSYLFTAFSQERLRLSFQFKDLFIRLYFTLDRYWTNEYFFPSFDSSILVLYSLPHTGLHKLRRIKGITVYDIGQEVMMSKDLKKRV